MPTFINPTIMINGEPVAYVPNSFAHRDGYGDRNTRTQTTGNGNVDQLITEDVETQTGYVKFTLISTTENFNKYDTWMANLDANAIELSAPGFNKQYARMTIMTENDKTGGQDASFDVEFSGSRAI